VRFIRKARIHHNNAKELAATECQEGAKEGRTTEVNESEAVERRDALGLDDAVGAAASEILKFL
jgi:hypothetical protein